MRTIRIALLGFALLVSGPLRAQDPAGLIPDDIERRLEGFYMFVTDGSGPYEIYQRLDSRKGLTEADPVVCLLHQCYVRIGQIEAVRLAERGEAGAELEPIRRSFRAGRDAYLGLLRSDEAGFRAAEAAWRDANRQILACVTDAKAC